MIYLISNRIYPASSKYLQVPLAEFLNWIKTVKQYQLDIETNVVDLITERKIYVIQFGSIDKSKQYVLDMASFPENALNEVKKVLKRTDQTKIIHNAIFEYSVIKQVYGIDIDNLYDTYLMLKVILNGSKTPKGIFSLKGAAKYYLNVDMSKDEQTTFTGEQMTENQVVYAAKDVLYLYDLIAYHAEQPYFKAYQNVIRLENRVVRAFGDIVVNGFVFDRELWEENIIIAEAETANAKREILKYIRENLYEPCVEAGFIEPEDKVTTNWSSADQRKRIFSKLYPTLINFSKPALRKFELTLEIPDEENALFMYLNNQYDELNAYLLKHHRKLLEEEKFLIKKNTVTINLDSPKQRLVLFRMIAPDLQSTAADEIKNLKNPFFKLYTQYIRKKKLVTSYGETWYNFVGSDGKIRPQYVDQVLDTGRVSMKKPGMMTLPADEGSEFGDRYREPFKPTPGFKLVTGDYSSQELCIIAYLAQEEVWMDALKNGKDLHSICANLVFKDKWTKAGGDPEGNSKPKSMEAKKLRSFTKTISFGLAYGGGPGMLAGRLNIKMNEASDLIGSYFYAFPKLKKYFEGLSEFGINNGFVMTAPPFKRRRYFANWNSDYIHPKDVSIIGRQSKNTPIQGTGADGSKTAMIYIKDFITKNNLDDKVHIVFMLHDAVVTEAREDFAEQWAEIMKELLESAHEINIPGRLIKAEMQITDYWTK